MKELCEVVLYTLNTLGLSTYNLNYGYETRIELLL